jgi:hypothetical protein
MTADRDPDFDPFGRGHASRWFYTKAMPEPMPETLEMLHLLAIDSDSASSCAILNSFRSYGLMDGK